MFERVLSDGGVTGRKEGKRATFNSCNYIRRDGNQILTEKKQRWGGALWRGSERVDCGGGKSGKEMRTQKVRRVAPKVRQWPNVCPHSVCLSNLSRRRLQKRPTHLSNPAILEQISDLYFVIPLEIMPNQIRADLKGPHGHDVERRGLNTRFVASGWKLVIMLCS